MFNRVQQKCNSYAAQILFSKFPKVSVFTGYESLLAEM
jgi:hypothetical protein